MIDQGNYLDDRSIKNIDDLLRRADSLMLNRPGVRRRSYDTGAPIPFVVTEVTSQYNMSQVGLGELVAVDSSFLYASKPVFAAKPYTAPDNATGIIPPTYLDDVDVSYVSPRMINCVIFTGQLILVQNSGQFIPSVTDQYSIVGDVLAGSTGPEYVGLVSKALPTTGNAVWVDIDVSEFAKFTPTTATRGSTCRVQAYNATGITFRNGQQVFLRHLANSKTNEQISRWRIVDYTCNVSS